MILNFTSVFSVIFMPSLPVIKMLRYVKYPNVWRLEVCFFCNLIDVIPLYFWYQQIRIQIFSLTQMCIYYGLATCPVSIRTIIRLFYKTFKNFLLNTAHNSYCDVSDKNDSWNEWFVVERSHELSGYFDAFLPTFFKVLYCSPMVQTGTRTCS
jgi:hypothetical protein